MPTYEYQCEDCAHTFEEYQSIKAEALTQCPACGKPTLQRLIGTGGAVIFKGGGFYQTDYRSESYRQAAKSDSKSESSSSTTPAAADKPAAKSETATPAPKADAGAKT